VIAIYEHSSLFGLIIGNEGKKLYNIDARASVNNNDTILHFDNCDIEARNGTRCEYGSSNDYQVPLL